MTATSARTPKLDAVLFDMDGTIVDTEPYWIAAEYRLVESFGGTWSEEHAHHIVGSALITGAAYIRAHSSVDLEPAQIVERLLDDVVAACRVEIPWRPGARELLLDLSSRGVPCALVTMSYERLATTICAQLPAGTFTTVVTGDEVANGKPHPEPYLLAMQRLGVTARGCVAIEDSPTGVASATAAGVLVLAVPHHVPVAPSPEYLLRETLLGLDTDAIVALVAAD